MTEAKPESWDRLQALFKDALQCDVDQRAALVGEACGGDRDLQARLEELLAAHEQAERVLQSSAASETARLQALQSAAASIPRQIGRYHLKRLIATGGMGMVYEAEQENPPRTVALKVIRAGATSPKALRRFEHEGHVLGLLQHPGIAQIFEAGTFDTGAGAQPFFAMEFIDGEPLTEYADSNTLGTRQRLDLFARVCDAVHYAHQRGVVHRDLKPTNILVGESGEPKILDFGVARATDSDIQTTTLHTEIGELIGTIPYMSPEQVTGDRDELDIRSDVYALGVVLYELLADRLPHDLRDKSIPEAARIIREEGVTPLSSINRIFRGDIETIVAKALAKEKERRYQSAAELATDIRHYLNYEPIEARPPSAIYQMRKYCRRHRVAVGSGVIFTALLVIGIISTSWGLAEAVRERDRAFDAEAKATRELMRANAVVALIDGLFSSADPHERKGPNYTVRQLLDDFERTIGDQFEGQPLVEASIRHTVGNAYLGLGLPDEAEGHLQDALDLRTQLLGEHDPLAFRTRQSLISVHHNRGEYAEAERRIRVLLEEVNEVENVQDLHTLRRSLADMYHHQGRYAEAEPLFVQGLEIRQQLLGDEHPDTLSSMNYLANLYNDQGRYDEAETLYLQALDAKKRVLGDEHTSTINSMNNLANLYADQGRYDEAKPLRLKTLEIRKRVLGDEHPDTLGSMHSLAGLYYDQSRYDEAETLLLQELEISKRVLGEEHPDALESINGLANLYAAQGRYDEAEPLHLKTLEIRKRVMGDEHPNTLGTITNLGLLYLSMKRFDDARAMFESSLPIKRRVLGMGHPWTRYALRGLARAYDGLDRGDDALPLWRELQEFQLAQVEDPAASAQMLNAAAWNLLTDEHAEVRDPARALPLAQRAVDKAGGVDPGILDTLALAQFMTGDTAAAIETETKALSLLPPDAPGLGDYEAALAKFEAALEDESK